MANVERPRAGMLAPRGLVAIRRPPGMRCVAMRDKMDDVLDSLARAREDDEERQYCRDAAEPNHFETVSQRPCRPLARRWRSGLARQSGGTATSTYRT